MGDMPLISAMEEKFKISIPMNLFLLEKIDRKAVMAEISQWMKVSAWLISEIQCSYLLRQISDWFKKI
jgi:acyl carrier protein